MRTPVDVVFPYNFGSPSEAPVSFLLGLCFCTYMVYSFCFHYHQSITTPPGVPADGPIPTEASGWNMYFLASPSGSMSKRSLTGRKRAIEAIKQSQTKLQQPLPVPSNASSRQQRVLSRTCKKCPPVVHGGSEQMPYKPERAHHCRICKTCFLCVLF